MIGVTTSSTAQEERDEGVATIDIAADPIGTQCHTKGEHGSDDEQEEDDSDYDDDDDEGWINPENLEKACSQMGGVSEEVAKGLTVACVTTDFAMQVE